MRTWRERWAVAARLLASGTATVATIGVVSLRSSEPMAQAAQGTQPAASPDVFACVRAVDEAAVRGVWPGFEPAGVPLAVFNGEETLLLRHPGPPPEFSPMPGRPGVFVAPGRHSAVQGNSNRDIGGVRTATVVVTPGQPSEQALLAMAEEMFHVFWHPRHPSIRPDELARYAYPITDVDNIRRLLAEDEALARALEADVTGKAARWAAAALRFRRERVPALSEDVRAFESALEMLEGPANYVARIAVGEPPGRTADRLRAQRPADEIRWRFYDSGAALCLLLDRLSPGWKTRIDAPPEMTLVELAEAALRDKGVEAATLPAAEHARLATRAAAAVEDTSARRRRLRAELLDRPGRRLIVEVEAGAEPFRVQRFDPINLMVLDAGEIAHPHFLSLVLPQGTVELTNPGFVRRSFSGTVAMTAPAGAHPLRHGVRRVTVVGIQGDPVVDTRNAATSLDAAGVRVTLRDVDTFVERDEIRIVVKRAPR